MVNYFFLVFTTSSYLRQFNKSYHLLVLEETPLQNEASHCCILLSIPFLQISLKNKCMRAKCHPAYIWMHGLFKMDIKLVLGISKTSVNLKISTYLLQRNYPAHTQQNRILKSFSKMLSGCF
jgi:hypothetical protein